MIYSLIEERAPIVFDDLKSSYLKRAQELLSRNAPKRVIQDDSLKRVLLDLQSDGLIVRRENLSYQVQVRPPVEPWALEEYKRMQRASLIKPKLLALTESRRPASIWLRRKS